MTPLDAYWTFAHRRHEMWHRRVYGGDDGAIPDPVLEANRFTNAYRVLDRVSQHLVRHVQYDPRRRSDAASVLFRTILFKIFNRIETWSLLERSLGSTAIEDADRGTLVAILDDAMARGATLYSAAYIMPTPPHGHARKHANHVEMLFRMMDDGVVDRVSSSDGLGDVYRIMLERPGIGRFLAFQYAVDLGYSAITPHGEESFVVAGPGAIDGLSKTHPHVAPADAERAIMGLFETQEAEFERRDLPFRGLFGRRLQPIDLQNCLCETSKYTRATHPEVAGSAGRTRIKQRYRAHSAPLDAPFLPPKWGVVAPAPEGGAAAWRTDLLDGL